MSKLISAIFILGLGLGCQTNSYEDEKSIEIRIENGMPFDMNDVKIFYYKGYFITSKIKSNQSYFKTIVPISDSSLRIEYRRKNKLINKKIGVYFSKGMSGTILLKVKSLKVIDIENNLTVH